MMENPWKKLSSALRYDNQWISLTEHQVLNPAGKPGIYGVVHFKNTAVAVLPLDDDMNTWLVGQYRFTLDSFEWELPEGGCPGDESTREAAQRELQEETGLHADEFIPFLHMQLSNSVTDEVSVSYIARGLKFIGASPEESEQLHVRKIPFDEAVRMAIDGEIRDALSVATLLKAKLLYDQGKLFQSGQTPPAGN